MTDDLIARLRALEPERTRNSEFGTMIYAEAADRLSSLEEALRRIEARRPVVAPKTPGLMVAHEMADIASTALSAGVGR